VAGPLIGFIALFVAKGISYLIYVGVRART